MVTTSVRTNEIKTIAPLLEAGNRILVSGTVYTARDAAHKRIFALIKEGQPLPFDLDGSIIYYMGPTPAREGQAIGSAGPTTSCRMDVYTPLLLDNGLCGMIGKGNRSKEVADAIIRNKAVYFCAVGGAGALYSTHITSCEVIAFPELGCESVKKLEVIDFPLTVGLDCKGGSIFAPANPIK